MPRVKKQAAGLSRTDEYSVYNDDVQGTAGITLAGMINATRLKGNQLKDEKYLFRGAGSATIGLANLFCSLVAHGLTMTLIDKRPVVLALSNPTEHPE